MIHSEKMILLGATARNTGKTALAVRLIAKHSKTQKVAAIKVVTVHKHGDVCPRGGDGCGICRSLKTCFDIREESGEGTKDTMLFRQAGAEKVYLVRAYPEGLERAMAEVLSYTDQADVIICESNSVRQVVKPGAFIMLSDGEAEIKPSAAAVIDDADKILTDYLDYFKA